MPWQTGSVLRRLDLTFPPLPIESTVSGALWSWSAQRLAVASRSGAVLAREAKAPSLQRVPAVNCALNAFVDCLPTGAGTTGCR